MKKLSILFIFLFILVLLPSGTLAASCSDYKSMGTCGNVTGCKWTTTGVTKCIGTPTAVKPAASSAAGTSGESSGTGLGSALGKLKATTDGSGLSANLETTLGAIIKGALSLVGTVFLILTVYAGILWMTARGDDAQVEKSTKIIRASVIGLFITLSAYAITYYITQRLTQAT